MKENNWYTGVGPREIDEVYTDRMSDLAVILYGKDYWLRSGRAEGCDYAFQRGAEYPFQNASISSNTVTKQRIYIPNERFNTCFGQLGAVLPSSFDNYPEAERIMEDVHPRGKYLRGFSREAHTRNVYQVLGDDLETPSKFLLCALRFTLGKPTGGTATAYNLAKLYGVPTYNFFNEKEYIEACEMILSL